MSFTFTMRTSTAGSFMLFGSSVIILNLISFIRLDEWVPRDRIMVETSSYDGLEQVLP